MDKSASYSHLLKPLCQLAQAAGEAILEVYQRADQGVRIKADDSPVTDADMAAHQTIVDGLFKTTPHMPVLSEENADIPWTTRQAWPRYWLVDPLDGTREFIKHNDEFTVNIALVEGHRPVLAVVQVPVTGDMYFASKGEGAWRIRQGQKDRLQTRPAHAPYTVMMSRSHRQHKQEALLADIGEYAVINRGSSLKFCYLAEAQADLYVRPGLTSEWDSAAAQCILEQAGGAVTTFDGEPLEYNTKDSLLNPEFIAVGDPARMWHHRLAEI